MESSAQQPQQNPLANYQFSTDELRVLRECNTESFFQRSLPFGTALGVGAYLAVKNGFLQMLFRVWVNTNSRCFLKNKLGTYEAENRVNLKIKANDKIKGAIFYVREKMQKCAYFPRRISSDFRVRIPPLTKWRTQPKLASGALCVGYNDVAILLKTIQSEPNLKYGAVPKVVVGVAIGYFVGKFSYQQKCAEKLMRLPNSRLGDLLRQRKQDGSVMSRLNPDQGIGIGLALSPFNSTSSEEQRQEFSRGTTLNLDVESRPSIAGLDDIYRPSLDNSPSPFYDTEIPIEPKRGMSYEELRKKNREEYEKTQQNPFSRPLPSNAPVIIRGNEASKNYSSDSNTQSSTNVPHKNKYGDTWTD